MAYIKPSYKTEFKLNKIIPSKRPLQTAFNAWDMQDWIAVSQVTDNTLTVKTRSLENHLANIPQVGDISISNRYKKQPNQRYVKV